MRKLNLDLEELAVESFAPAAEADARGTVVARATITCYDTCGGCPTYYCEDSVDWSCDVDTCAWTCGVCEPSVNEATTCIAPCSYGC